LGLGAAEYREDENPYNCIEGGSAWRENKVGENGGWRSSVSGD